MKTEVIKVIWRDVPGAGKGLVALEDLPPSASLFAIPSTALLNCATISPYFPPGMLPTSHRPRSELTSTQALALYLAVFRRKSDSPWAAYFKTLPTHFDGHPLVLRMAKDVDGVHCQEIIEQGPPSLRRALDGVEGKFREDWSVVRALLARTPGLFALTSPPTLRDFLWAWLIVNTRTLSHPLKLSRSIDNITLAPLFDMFNHSPDATSVLSIERSRLVLRSPNIPIKKGEQIYIRYGGHGNTALFTEYGFVLGQDAKEIWRADVEDLVVERFIQEGESGKEKLLLLEETGYSKDHVLYYHPPPTHPSYCLIVALRLLHSPLASLAFTTWRQSLEGSADFAELFPAVDQMAEDTLKQICAECRERAEASLRHLQSVEGEDVKNIRALWEEESLVAGEVERGLTEGLIDF